MRIIAASLAATLLIAPPSAKAASEEPAASMTTVDTATFVKTAAGANMFEIESSKLAEEKSQKADIKSFAKMIVADHTKAGENLKATLAADKSALQLLAGSGMSAREQAMIEQLNAASADDFDVIYIDMQTKAHKDAVALFRSYAGSGDDKAIVGFAKETLPILEKHLKHVELLEKS